MPTPPKKPFDVRNWYWGVSGIAGQVYSSAIGDYVPETDPTYQAWIAAGYVGTRIATETELGDYLAKYYLRPASTTSAANVLSAYQASCATNMDLAIFNILYDHESRIRVLAGQTAITQTQFKRYIAGLM
jgi:hypothetical protein